MTRSTDPQLVELQTQFAFQEDLLRELNEVIVRQQQQIDALERELNMHRDKLVHILDNLPEKGATGNPLDERPPHY
ncbi:MAG: SlyX family protein [Pseudomonadales bacterium]|nr:SlyX family protein [Pseudomonadales bacterium]MCP5358662.1 SlyX family protein [Pseudomonadales bacterium]